MEQLAVGVATMRERVGEAYASVSRKFDPSDLEGGGGSASERGGMVSPSGALPDSPVVAAREASANSAGLSAIFKCFNDQRELVRALTNLAEELRFLEPAERQRRLQARGHHSSLPLTSPRASPRLLTSPLLSSPRLSSPMQPGLDGVEIPPDAFFPLGQSSAPLHRLLRFSYGENVVFNTKARHGIA
jgi:hypothetical protein